MMKKITYQRAFHYDSKGEIKDDQICRIINMDGDDNDMQNVYALLYICSHLTVTFTGTCHKLSKIYSISCSAIFLAKRIVATTYGVTRLKR